MARPRRMVQTKRERGVCVWARPYAAYGARLMMVEATQKRHEHVAERSHCKLATKRLLATLTAWRSFVARINWERVIVKRFAAKGCQRRVRLSFKGWLGHVAGRRHNRTVLKRAFVRLAKRMLRGAFEPWVYTNKEAAASGVETDAKERRRELAADRFIFKCERARLLATLAAGNRLRGGSSGARDPRRDARAR